MVGFNENTLMMLKNLTDSITAQFGIGVDTLKMVGYAIGQLMPLYGIVAGMVAAWVDMRWVTGLLVVGLALMICIAVGIPIITVWTMM